MNHRWRLAVVKECGRGRRNQSVTQAPPTQISLWTARAEERRAGTSEERRNRLSHGANLR